MKCYVFQKNGVSSKSFNKIKVKSKPFNNIIIVSRRKTPLEPCKALDVLPLKWKENTDKETHGLKIVKKLNEFLWKKNGGRLDQQISVAPLFC